MPGAVSYHNLLHTLFSNINLSFASLFYDASLINFIFFDFVLVLNEKNYNLKILSESDYVF